MYRRISLAWLGSMAVVLLVGATAARAQSSQPPPAAAAAANASTQPQLAPAPLPCKDGKLDAEAATKAYLATLPADQKARSDAYFEGGYWLMLWDFLAASAVYILLLAAGWSERMRDWAERVTRFKPVHTFIYWAEFVVVTSVLLFPLSVYEGYIREHQYGRATQTFGPWFGDQTKGLAVGIIFGGVMMAFLYGVVRRAPRTWWLWGSVTMVVFLTFFILIAPVYVAPLFNKYIRLEDPAIRDPILSLARANGIPAHEVFVEDASRQSTRISAHVAGMFGTEQIVLNDNLLKRCSREEIVSVMGHEMGHSVLHHVYGGILFFGLLIVIGFAWLRRTSAWALGRWGERWGTREAGDVASQPLMALLISLYFFVFIPINNTFTRNQEYEADIFGLDAAREPDGEAQVDLKLAEYRKLDPGPVEEFIFYDHPSGRARIFVAMRWKAENTSACRDTGSATGQSKPQ